MSFKIFAYMYELVFMDAAGGCTYLTRTHNYAQGRTGCTMTHKGAQKSTRVHKDSHKLI